MTDAEKKARMTERNDAICTYYLAGHKLHDCASKFQLGRQRTLQILQAAGVWKPYEKSDRTKFLGVNVSEQTRDGLRRKAEEAGVSVSRLASDVLDEVVMK